MLLVPGYTGSKEDFAPLFTPLAEGGQRVVALDQRGQYESPGGDDPQAYTVSALATDLLAVADDLVGPRQKVHLLGHSFGGLVARAAVLARPAQFASITLMSSGPDRLVGPRAEVLAQLAPLLDRGGLPMVYEAMQQLAAADPAVIAPPPELAEFLRTRFLASSAAALRAMAAAMTSEPDRVSLLVATGVPVLVLHGAGDDAWSPQVQTEMAQRLGAKHVVIPDAMHSPALDNPDATVAALLDFWQGASL